MNFQDLRNQLVEQLAESDMTADERVEFIAVLLRDAASDLDGLRPAYIGGIASQLMRAVDVVVAELAAGDLDKQMRLQNQVDAALYQRVRNNLLAQSKVPGMMTIEQANELADRDRGVIRD